MKAVHILLAFFSLLTLHAAEIPTFWIVGDSTVHGSTKGQSGWGDELGPYFDPAKIHLVNKAIGGRSSRTFLSEGRWTEVLNGINPGDFVIIQFGHNDVGSTGESSRFRGSVKGTGDETVEVTKPDGTTETVHSYGWYLRNYITTAKEKKATVIIASSIPHKKWENGRFVRDFIDYGQWAKASAETAGASFIDLTAIISRKYQEEGEEKVATYYADERTHTTPDGARSNARSVVAGLKSLPGNPFEKFLTPAAAEITPFK